MQASQLTHPRLRVLYRLDGGPQVRERTLPLAGYLGSVPVRIGNGAAGQLQLDVYGDLFQAAWLYAEAGRPNDPDIGRRLAEIADLVCRIWPERDAGLWEVRSGPQHFTQSKMMCFVALDRALRLARAGRIPSRHATRWQKEANVIRDFVEEHCWSETMESYVRHADTGELDASLLLGVLFRYAEPGDPRLLGTVEAVRRELSHGPFVYRYSDEDGLAGKEGAFLTCSFWLAEALAVQGRRTEATDLMEQLVGLANDVGLRLGTRRHLRAGPRSVLGDRTGEHPATSAAPPHGHAVHRRRLLPARRGARLPDAQLRTLHPPGEPRSPRPVRTIVGGFVALAH